VAISERKEWEFFDALPKASPGLAAAWWLGLLLLGILPQGSQSRWAYSLAACEAAEVGGCIIITNGELRDRLPRLLADAQLLTRSYRGRHCTVSKLELSESRSPGN
jgi:hypothetical protein